MSDSLLEDHKVSGRAALNVNLQLITFAFRSLRFLKMLMFGLTNHSKSDVPVAFSASVLHRSVGRPRSFNVPEESEVNLERALSSACSGEECSGLPGKVYSSVMTRTTTETCPAAPPCSPAWRSACTRSPPPGRHPPWKSMHGCIFIQISGERLDDLKRTCL